MTPRASAVAAVGNTAKVTQVTADEWRFHGAFHVHPFPDASVDASFILNSLEFQGGRINLWVEKGPRLLVAISPPNASTYSVRSRELVFKSSNIFEVGLGCDHEKALLFVNGELAGTAIYPMADRTPLAVYAPPGAQAAVDAFQTVANDYQAKIIAKRRNLRASTSVKPNRRALEPSEFLRGIKSEVSQIRDLVRLINGGSVNHMHGLSSRIRATICYMGNKRDLPLLQYCASFKELPLPVFIRAPDRTRTNNADEVIIGSRIFPQRIHADDIELDLDFWLLKKDTEFDGKKIDNNDLIRNFSETRGGAHHDKSVDPNIDEYMLNTWQVLGGNGMYDAMTALLLEVGITIVHLGQQVIAVLEKESDQTS